MKKLLMLICTLSMGSLTWAQAPSLGSAATFAVLGSSTVTCTNASTITGDVGVSPGTAITGFNPDCTLTGTLHPGDAIAFQAHHDAALAYAFLVAETCGTNLSGQDLGGLFLGPGVYCFDTSAFLTGTLNLTGGGPWIFQIGSTLITGSASAVLVNGNGFSPTNCNPGVFWQVGSSATLGSGSQFQGVVLALITDTLVAGTNVSGGVFALTGAVTMDTNQVNACSSGGATPPAGTIKVTGGGEIGLSPGTASFGFNAGTGKDGSGGHFNYFNHVSGLHFDGPVNDVVVIAFNPDRSPKTVLFSGTCRDSCAFSVTVQDNAEPGINVDQFGVTVTIGASVVEFRSQRVISAGNIQFHP